VQYLQGWVAGNDPRLVAPGMMGVRPQNFNWSASQHVGDLPANAEPATYIGFGHKDHLMTKTDPLARVSIINQLPIHQPRGLKGAHAV
jgi:hypothetical protein